MDLMKILRAHDVEPKLAEDIEMAIKSDIHKSFVPKSQYNKKIQELDGLREENDDFKARAELPNEYETKYNKAEESLKKLQGEFDAYKNDIQLKETRRDINERITKQLQGEGFKNEKVLKLMMKDLDYNNISIDEEGEMQGFDLNAFTEEYKEFKEVSNVEGSAPSTPPSNTTTEQEAILMGYC